ncbi:thiamine pyrophosphate-binding protein [Sphingobium nicotianae]|uniref:Thiamine pyrophosphate-binding protein n=1 Tax=Sphingobium nicotianae TaxID=2782607 RepID=A0A9X1DCV8_9SPHN|nr:thiamine pyrophosphate-binding protein [Sphingobium nicotianae]MBT2187802.1 thiamine pyrophosphate-binding protein [Sphingobium nicotianae]
MAARPEIGAASLSVTDAMVEELARRGVTHMFGVPGGECNLDFIAAADRAGVRFVLTRTETSASIMACVAGELTGASGVAMTTRGPGLCAAANGVAYADLDRAALLLIADGYEDDQAYISHQRIDQGAVLAPMLRAQSDLRSGDALGELDRLLAAASEQPPGPAYLEVAGSRIRRPAADARSVAATHSRPALDLDALEQARTLLGEARRPVVVAGLQARRPEAAAALNRFVAATGCPVLTTYKAKGVVSERTPLGLGLYANGLPEAPLLTAADLIILYGFDPVEGPPSPWRYGGTPTLELSEHAHAHSLLDPELLLVADIARTLDSLADALPVRAWTAAELAAAKDRLWTAARTPASEGIAPSQLVDAARAAFPPETRITIDAGAHMLPVLHLWQSGEANQSLISRGLSTMGFALPAAIAASLVDPARPTVAFTGDGGIMMCLGELGTAIQYGATPIVIVFNDSSLTLIGAKQKRRQLAAAGVDFSDTDFAAVAAGFGWWTRRVTDAGDLAAAFADAQAAGRAALIDVVINPAQYEGQILAIRG